MDQATAARHRLEAVEVRTRSLCRVATPRCRPGSGGTDRRQPTWPLATRKQPRAHHRAANDLSQITRPSFHRRTAACLIRRTAGYGPVCPVVWEGRSRKTSPYPDGARQRFNVGRFWHDLRPSSTGRQLQNRGLLAFFQERQKNDLAIRKFQRVVMVRLLVLIDLAKNRGLVVDHALTPRPHAYQPNLLRKGLLRPWHHANCHA